MGIKGIKERIGNKASLIISSFLFYVFVISVFFSCNFHSIKTDTPNQGEITMASDNTIQPIINQELDLFGYDYPNTQIHCKFLPETEIFKELLKDSIRFAVTTRLLKPEERTHFSNRKIEIYQNKVATDAIALIVNRNNADSTIRLNQVKEVLEGSYKNWENLSPNSPLGTIQIILDQNGSSIERTILEKLGSHALDSKNIFSLKGNATVAEYVAKNPNALGFIGMNWLNNNDSLSTSLISKIRIMQLSADLKNSNPSGKVNFYLPTPENINTKKYPFIRTVYTLSVEGHTGLGTGFAVFLASDKGQLIFSKSGVLPIREINREININ